MERERERLILWIPVLFACGIFTYFSIKFEPDLEKATYILTPLTLLFLYFHLTKRTSINIFIIFLIAFIGGFYYSSFTAHSKDSAIIEPNLGIIWIRATIEKIEQRQHGKRIYLTDNDLWQRPPKGKFSANETPKRMRLNVRTDIDEGIKPGSRVHFKASLSPPPKLPVYPNGYDFARFAYFEEIGAVGYSISDIKKYTPKGQQDSPSETNTIRNILENIRFKITQNIINNFDDKNAGNIATALITAEKGGISKSAIESMRASGLGHLLAISGLHMALVMTGFFFITRSILALIPYISLRYETKKIAAISALAVGGFYLCITGFPISAQRSYIMFSIFFLAITIDRTGTPLRSVAFAALFIMLLSPETVISASFQMSFAAVIALIGMYEMIYLNRKSEFIKFTPSQKIKTYIYGTLLSTLIAGMATAPYSIYNFGTYSNYSLMANIVAIPVTTFWIMPFGILSLIAMPFSLENFPLYMMEKGVELLIDYSTYITSFEGSVTLFPEINSYIIAAITFSLLWFFIWQTKLRYFSLPILTIAAIGILLSSNDADIIIDEKGSLFAVKNSQNQLVFSSFTKARYARNQWTKKNGQEKPIHMRDYEPSKTIKFECSESICEYGKDFHNVAIIRASTPPLHSMNAESSASQLCMNFDLIINLSESELSCPTRHPVGSIATSGVATAQDLAQRENIIIITKSDLKNKGTHVINLTNKIEIKSAFSERGNRIWGR